MDVNGDRLRSDIETNATFGAIDAEAGRGRTALTGTPPNRRGREYLVDRLEAAGLAVRVDAVGNVAGRWVPDGVTPDTPAVATGSHLDSVPRGGIFDGPLGVYAALEAVRAVQGSGIEPARPIEVVCFTEEEGQRFAEGLLGSSVAAGERSVEAALRLADDDGTTLDAALTEIGFRGEGRLDAREWDAWIELHVEQNDRLEAAGVPVGVVTTITGITHCEVVVEGETDHAGATSMADRDDALAAASEFVLDVESAAREATTADDTAVGTVGRLAVEPNATNVVPGRVGMGLDVRSTGYATMNAIVERARASLARITRERDVTTGFERSFDLRPTPMSERCREIPHTACTAVGIEPLAMHSGAAHDTMYVASATDAGLLFAPSRDGASHSPREWTDWADCTAATRVLAETVAALAT